MNLIITKNAEKCILNIRRYHELNYNKEDQSYIDQMLSEIASIPSFPFAGQQVESRSDPTLRKRYYKPYWLIYRVAKNTATLLAVVHERQILTEQNLK